MKPNYKHPLKIKIQNFIFELFGIKRRCTKCIYFNGYNECDHPMFEDPVRIWIDKGICTIGYIKKK